MKKNDKIWTGIAIGAGGVLAGKVIKDKINKTYINSFLRACSDFENSVKKNLKKKRVAIGYRVNMTDIIVIVDKRNMLSRQEIFELKKIRDMRNNVSHGNQDALTKDLADSYSKKLRTYIMKLSA